MAAAGSGVTSPPHLETLEPRWDGPCIVAATGPSLTEEVAAACAASGYPIIAIKQAVQMFPDAQVLYALDRYWWEMFKGVPGFTGEKWIAWCRSLAPQAAELQPKYGLRVIRGDMRQGFSTNPAVVHYGRNSGFQAIGLAIHWLRPPKRRIILVGFDMQAGKKRPYFFGQHPRGPQHQNWTTFIPEYDYAAKHLPAGVEIINASEKSALRCFQIMPLAEALAQEARAA